MKLIFYLAHKGLMQQTSIIRTIQIRALKVRNQIIRNKQGNSLIEELGNPHINRIVLLKLSLMFVVLPFGEIIDYHQKDLVQDLSQNA